MSRWLLRVMTVWVGVWMVVGCEPDYESVDHPKGDEAWEAAHDVEVDDDEVVATVDGYELTRADVEAKWRDMPEADLEEVLDELIEREILAHRARDRGVHERPEVEFARKQGLVSALLVETVEAEAEIDESRRDDVREHAVRTRRAPEGLRASHLVVLVPEERENDEGETVDLEDDEIEALYDRAREDIEEARRMLDGRVDNLALREVAGRLEEDVVSEGLEVQVNEHMRFPRDGEHFDRAHLPGGWVAVVPEFAEGAETVAGDDERGRVVSEPVRTDFGWHLIRVDEVIEARPVDPEVLDDYVDFELQRGAREARLHQEMEEWADGVPAQVYPDRLGSALEE